MKIHNGKPIIKVDWGMKSNGNFETFPETFFYSVEEDEVSEVGLVALVKSDNQVFGISSEGDTYQDIYEKSEWTSNSVFDFIGECDPEMSDGFKYHHGDAVVLNPNGVIVAGVEGIRASDGTYIKYANVKDYMIEELIPQWRLLQPGVTWDIFKLYDDLEDRYSKTSKDIPFTLDATKAPIIYIKNEHGFIIAKQGDTEHNDDFVGLIQEDGTFDDSPWKDLTEDKIKCHLKIWEDFGKDMSQEELAIARDDDPVPEVEDSVEIEASNPDNSAEISYPKWFVCYEDKHFYDCCPPQSDRYDGEFTFNPETENLSMLKAKIVDYLNGKLGKRTDDPRTTSHITIISLTKLT